MRLATKALLIGALVVVGFTPARSEAGPIGPGDFGLGTQTTTFDGLGLSDPFAAPLVIDGLTITSDTGSLRYNNFSGCLGGISSDCLGTTSAAGFIDVVFDSPVLQAGAYGSGFLNWTIEAEFFDNSDVSLGTVVLAGAGVTPEFAGWEDAGGIARMRFTDLTANNFIEVFDNVMVVVPEPSAALLLASGLAVLGARRRDTRRRIH